MFHLFPAIDLRGGRVVRLEQGDYARETHYDRDPLAIAKGYFAAGAALYLRISSLVRSSEGGP